MKIGYLPLVLLLGSSSIAQAQAVLLKDINPGISTGVHFLVGTKVMNNKLYFAAQDTLQNLELWSTDGTTTNTVLVKDISTVNGSSPASMHVFNNNLFFAATTATEGTELYKTDGTATGTSLFSDIWAGTTSSYPNNFMEYNNSLFFTAEEPTSGGFHHVLYKSDGTLPNTAIMSTAPWTMGTMYYIMMNSKFYFGANNSVSNTGIELWESDGTGNGTSLLVDLLAGSAASNPEYLTKFGTNKFVFSATTPATGYELYISDGTAVGTTLIKDINPGAGNSYADGFTEFNGKIYFFANDGVNGTEPWVTDGTAVGTMMLANTDNAATNGIQMTDYCLVNNKLMFTAKTVSGGREIWTTDGTPTNTNMFMDINAGATDGVGTLYAENVIDGYLYFVANDGTNGDEPWVTDGTAINTKMLHNINPGINRSMFNSEYRFKKVNNKILFVANDSVTGNEIWTVDAPVGVNEIAKINEVLTLYPNPTKGIFHIQGAVVIVNAIINNQLGQVVYNGAVENNTISMVTNPAGIYTVTMTDKDGNVYNERLHLQR